MQLNDRALHGWGFIVNELGQEPLTISVYEGGVSVLATLCNKYFARKIDASFSA